MSRVVPLLMVLYSNDAVEVRYSDGSTLQLSACGSTMIHHDAATPRRGKGTGSSGTIHKRSRFVTSEHRHKVLQAMDFRNRFAERPYLCKELLDKDQIVNANVWLPSEQDLVQYKDALSHIDLEGERSQYMPYNTNKQTEPFSNSSINSHDISSISRSSTPDGLRMTIDSDASLGMQDNSGLAHMQACSREVYRQRHSSPTQFISSPCAKANQAVVHRTTEPQFYANGAHTGSCLTGDGVAETGGEEDCGLDRTVCEEDNPPGDLSRTVVGEEGEETSSPPSQQALGSTDVRFPVPGGADPQAPTPILCNANRGNVTPIGRVTYEAETISEQPCHSTHGSAHEEIPRKFPPEDLDNSELSPQSEEKSQSLYVWTTTHVSQNACPPAWTHPLKLVLTTKSPQDHHHQNSSEDKPTTASKGKQSSPLPMPLPVTCPFQHLHKWDAEKTLDVSDVTGSLEFQHGMLKVVISEGIVYRSVLYE
ncbi:chromosome 5 open reading frame 34 [Elysia marginata]|uniref:Chromosome 5 open reading frame 34 n=1 Tax=Elysia marginata TaxID=1093978 RepID=A0AAV4FE16_9GAST|nr:chromosome 5 open reading frame 34 [Elysia marginata]